ncbi:MAG: hypothetical protein KBB54_03990 [Candidatus Pacebacteria bacterium]|nr:hypothetical protein [Candidatus Paceibacterota bacterium]MBP9700902.1 hypothetical protein [Candidatus Paceibacterota bacterium]
MTTIINTPGNNGEGGNGFGIVIIIILILVGGFLFYRYGWRKASPAAPAAPAATINVTVPTGTTPQ